MVLIFAQRERAFYRLIGAAMLPLCSGLLTMYLDNRFLDTGRGMFGRLISEAIAAGRRDAIITACIGASGAMVVFLMGLFGLKKNKNRRSSGEQTND